MRLQSDTAILLLALGARILSSPTADLSYLMLAGYALLGRRHVVQAFALSWLFTMLNPGLVPDASYGAIGRYLVLFAGVLSVTLCGGWSRLDRFGWLTMLLGVFFSLHALVFSPMPDVSILKAVSWTLAMLTLLAAWAGLDGMQREGLRHWLFTFLMLIAAASLPLLLVPPIGYLRNGSGFQGVLSHPQVFGPMMAILAAMAVGRMLMLCRPPWKQVVLSLGCLALVLLSESRTAGFALVLGTLFALGVSSFGAGRAIGTIAPAFRSKRLFLLGVAGLVAVLVAGSQVSGVVNRYIAKSGRAQVGSVMEAYQDSREILYLAMLANIAEKPWSGIGFGVASVPELMQVSRDPVLGLPVGASVEKGVVPLAVLEEVGIPGFMLAVLWVGALLRRAYANGLVHLLVAAVALLINMGEAFLFSPGGMGMLVLIVLSSSAAVPALPVRRQGVRSPFSAVNV